jgi:hypothetical protein
VSQADAPATVHTEGVLLPKDTGRELEALQERATGERGPTGGAHVMVCAVAPLENETLAPPTMAHAPDSAARQPKVPDAPLNSVCQGYRKSALRIVGKEATPRPGGDEEGVVREMLVPGPSLGLTVIAGTSAVRYLNPASEIPASCKGPAKPAVNSAPPVPTKRASTAAFASMAAASAAMRPAPGGLLSAFCFSTSDIKISRGFTSPQASAVKKAARLPPKARAPAARPSARYALLHHEPVTPLQASTAFETYTAPSHPGVLGGEPESPTGEQGAGHV